MTVTWVKSYLDRIGYQGPTAPNASNLANLQQAHVQQVPFEVLDIHRGTELSLNLENLKEKVIGNHRGGFCYELNYLFGSLLIELGYQIKYLSGRVFNEITGMEGPEYDHMALSVSLKREWLADVGFGGRAFTRPLEILSNKVQSDPAGYFRIDTLSPGRLQVMRSLDGFEFQPLYNFTTQARSIEEFYQQCSWKQKDPESHFVKNKICTLATPDGRKSILNDIFSIRTGSNKLEITIRSEEHQQKILAEHFNLRY